MPLHEFGKYLRSLRGAPHFNVKLTQRQVADRLTGLGIPASQSLINKYEKGEVMDPEPTVLRGLARLYEVDYMDLVLRLVREKYRAKDDQTDSPERRLYDARLRVCEQALKPFSEIGGIEDPAKVADLEILQLEAKADLIGREQLLDVKGLAKWEREFPLLRRFWVAALQYADNDHPDIEEAVAHNLRRGVEYTYFIPSTEVGPRKSFWNLRARLLQRVPEADKQIVPIPLDAESIRNLSVDYAIANPLVQQQGSSPFAFQCIRRGASNQPQFAFPVDSKVLPGVIDLLAGYVETYMKSQAANKRTDDQVPLDQIKRSIEPKVYLAVTNGAIVGKG